MARTPIPCATAVVAVTLLVCPHALMAQTAEGAQQQPAAEARAVVDKALAYLKSQQQADGSWQRSPREPGFTGAEPAAHSGHTSARYVGTSRRTRRRSMR